MISKGCSWSNPLSLQGLHLPLSQELRRQLGTVEYATYTHHTIKVTRTSKHNSMERRGGEIKNAQTRMHPFSKRFSLSVISCFYLSERKQSLTIPLGKQQLPLEMLLHRERKHHIFTSELMLPHFHHSSACASVSDKIQGSIKTQLSFKSYVKIHYFLPTPCLQDSDGGVDLHLVMGHL